MTENSKTRCPHRPKQRCFIPILTSERLREEFCQQCLELGSSEEVIEKKRQAIMKEETNISKTQE